MMETAGLAPVSMIGERLATVARQMKVAIPLAVESGSRAWGFPSPDSDYDCRFIYIRAVSDYLSPWQRRDVIELPITDDLDMNGWDLAKALRLLAKGNATLVEWLTSPIAYRCDEAFRRELLTLARNIADKKGIVRHYLHLGEEQWRRHVPDPENAPLKKVFYALRPAAALRWLRVHEDESVAPMNLLALLGECDPPPGVVTAASGLVAAKAESREMASGRVPAALVAFIEAEFAGARASKRPASAPSHEAVEMAEDFFRRAVRRFDPDCRTQFRGDPESGASRATEAKPATGSPPSRG